MCKFGAFTFLLYGFAVCSVIMMEAPKWESYPYSPSARLNECNLTEAKTVSEGFANCRNECKFLGYPWGTCVPVPRCGFWYPMCSCFSKPYHLLAINRELLINPLLYKEHPPFQC